MATFAPLLADSLEGFNKYFLSFLVNKGVQDIGDTKPGIKGIKGGKHLSHLLSLYSCRVGGWVMGHYLEVDHHPDAPMSMQRVLVADYHTGQFELNFCLVAGFFVLLDSVLDLTDFDRGVSRNAHHLEVDHHPDVDRLPGFKRYSRGVSRKGQFELGLSLVANILLGGCCNNEY